MKNKRNVLLTLNNYNRWGAKKQLIAGNYIAGYTAWTLFKKCLRETAVTFYVGTAIGSISGIIIAVVVGCLGGGRKVWW